jgi:hypothetical protein
VSQSNHRQLTHRAAHVVWSYCPHRRPLARRAETSSQGVSNSAGERLDRMSWSPCSNCRGTGNGALRFVYVATFPDGKRQAHRLRLCSVCYDAFIPDLLVVAEVQDAVGRWLAPEARP